MGWALPKPIALQDGMSPTNPLGIKAGGEGGTTGALACVVVGDRRCALVCGIRNVTGDAVCGVEGD